MTTLDLTTLTDEQLAAVVAEARKRKTQKTKAEKYSHLEPHYTEYRKALVTVKEATKNKNRLLATLKSLGFGKKGEAPATVPTTTTPTTSTKGTKKKK